MVLVLAVRLLFFMGNMLNDEIELRARDELNLVQNIIRLYSVKTNLKVILKLSYLSLRMNNTKII